MKMKKSWIFIVLIAFILIIGVVIMNRDSDGNDSEAGAFDGGSGKILLETNMGNITIELRSDMPITAGNFKKLVASGFYDGIIFHRVISGFMIQGGDPLTKDDTQIGLWGTGDPGYKFEDEIHVNNHNEVGTIAMANSGPNTNGSQFFINVGNNNFLDSKHTVFGRVTVGMDVVGEIEQVETNASDRPLEPVVIKSVTLD